MAEACGDVLVAYPTVDAARLGRLAALAGRGVTVRMAADSAEGVRRLGEAARAGGVRFGVLADLDVGHHRTGVADVAAVVDLARLIDWEAGLQYDGLFCFPGHIIGGPREQDGALGDLHERLTMAVGALRDTRLEPGFVSAGSTPTALQSERLADVVTEVRPGTYAYYDANCVAAGWCRPEDVAATLLCTVVSDAVPGRVVIDAGSKSLTSDRLITDPDGGGHGYLPAVPGATVSRLSEEHGEVDVTRCDRPPRVGDRVHVVPNHVCPAVNLHDRFYLKETDGRLREMPVDARGMVH